MGQCSLEHPAFTMTLGRSTLPLLSSYPQPAPPTVTWWAQTRAASTPSVPSPGLGATDSWQSSPEDTVARSGPYRGTPSYLRC